MIVCNVEVTDLSIDKSATDYSVKLTGDNHFVLIRLTLETQLCHY